MALRLEGYRGFGNRGSEGYVSAIVILGIELRYCVVCTLTFFRRLHLMANQIMHFI